MSAEEPPRIKKKARADLIGRIRALRSKTMENGCTRDEAILAAEKAMELIDKYQIGLHELDLKESELKHETHPAGDEIGRRLWRVAAAIAKLTETRTWLVDADTDRESIVFYGLDHDVAVASYLLAIAERAMRMDAERFDADRRLLRPTVRRRLRGAFLDGMTESLTKRILELARKRPTGTGIVVAKKQIIEAGIRDEGLDFKDGRGSRLRSLEPGFLEGFLAGEKVSLNAGVRGAGKSDEIGTETA